MSHLAKRVAAVHGAPIPDVIDMVGPGTPPLGHPPGLTPARASLPRGLTPDPGAAHGGEDGPYPGPHPPHPGEWGRLTGAMTRNRGGVGGGKVNRTLDPIRCSTLV